VYERRVLIPPHFFCLNSAEAAVVSAGKNNIIIHYSPFLRLNCIFLFAAMKISNLVLANSLFATVVTAFQAFPRLMPTQTTQRMPSLAVGRTGTMMGTIDIQETAQRDVYSLQEWAQQCGAQTAEGFELITQDGEDWSVITNKNIQAGIPVLYVPAQMIMSSTAVDQEFGGNLMSAEHALTQFEGTAQRLPLFRLMVKKKKNLNI